MREISRYDLLTGAEEVELAKQIAAGDKAAQHKMVQANLRLVVKIARRYMNRGVALADLIEEGNLGLIRAVEKFDVAHGCRFSTYATWWVRQAVERALMNQVNMIRVPVHVGKEYKSVVKHANALRMKHEREPDDAEVAEAMGVSVKHVQHLMGVTIRTESADVSLHGEGDFTLYDVMPDSSAESPGDRLQCTRRDEMLQVWMAKLDKQERDVVCLRYGLGVGGEPWTLEMVGEQYGVTRERIRQIQVQALKKLREIVGDDDIDLQEVL
ncbi:MAG: sigma-70 family RNA polymerase sigma factor [Mariprofundus sp.]